MNDFLKTAILYHREGITCMPVKETKNPNLKEYTQFNKKPTDLDTVKTWLWEAAATHGVGIFTGAASGYVMVLDFDTKYDVSGNLFERWVAQVPTELYEKLVIAGSRSGGKHVYYRAPGSETRNMKLANRHTTYQERDKNPYEKEKVLIETRGNGGIIVCAPTPGYSWQQGDQTTIPTVTSAEELFLLSACRSFNEVVIEYQPKLEGTSYTRFSTELSPTEDYDNKADVNGLLMSHGWDFVASRGSKDHYKRPGDTQAKTSGNYDHDLKWFSVFSTSSQFEISKAYRPWMVYAILEHNGDYKAAYKALKAAGYGQFKRFDTDTLRKVRKYLSDEQVTDAKQYLDEIFENKDTADAYLKKAREPVTVIANSFWHFNDKDKLVISSSEIVDFITKSGFWKYYPSGNINHTYIWIKEGVAQEINSSVIKDFITKYIHNLPFEFDGIYRDQLFDKLFNASGAYFSSDKMEWLQECNLHFIKDSSKEAFVFFRNCVVKIEPGEIYITDYSALGNFIVWSHQVKDFDYVREDGSDCDFAQFMYLISAQDAEKTATHVKILGYLMHRYKNPARTFAIIGCEDTERVDQGGGTGKSLIGLALSKIIPTTFIEAKIFDPHKSFLWQSYSLGDGLINLDDLGKKFTIEDINSLITGDMTVERKNKPSITIPFEDSPKLYATTNYVVDDSQNSARRRMRRIVVSPYFSPDRQPEDVFGKMFFNEWQPEEWNKFYNYMLEAIAIYLDDPIIENFSSVNLDRKKFTTKYGEECLNFLINASTLESYKERHPVKDYWYPNFLEFSGQDSKTFSMRYFSQALKEASKSLFTNLTHSDLRISSYHFAPIEEL